MTSDCDVRTSGLCARVPRELHARGPMLTRIAAGSSVIESAVPVAPGHGGMSRPMIGRVRTPPELLDPRDHVVGLGAATAVTTPT